MARGAARSWQWMLGMTLIIAACHDDSSDTGPADDPPGVAASAGHAASPSAGLSGGPTPTPTPIPTPTGGGGHGTTAGAAGAEPTESVEGGAAGNAGAPGQPPRDLHEAPYPPSPYPVENPDSDAKALLGKILFWDEQLSGDNTVACGTCHRPNAGGADPRAVLPAAAQPGVDEVLGTADDIHGSLGVVRCNARGEHTGRTRQVTARKAPTYLDAMLPGRLFWDGRAECSHAACPSFSAFEDPDQPGTFPILVGGALENQAVGPPLSPVEMACEGATWPAIHVKLSAARPLALARQVPSALAEFIAANDASYPKLFRAAFGVAQTSGPEDQVNTRRIAFALATHERRLRSDQTPWDRWNGGIDEALTPGQLRGYEVFSNKARCQLCHRAPSFADGDFHFIGFHQPSWDLGRKVISSFATPGAMRTPTLRNVGLREATGLLHNGAGPGASLAQIVDLYDVGGLVENAAVKATPIDATIIALQLSPEEKADLLDFLRHGLEDPRVSAQTTPFDRPLLSTE